jgi:hypothetical protein
MLTIHLIGIGDQIFVLMGVKGLEPLRLLRSTDFHPFVAFTTALEKFPKGFKDWTLSLPSA